MATYERESWVRAPLEEVWEFHAGIDGLLALTPEWMNLRVERVVGPHGERDPDVLDVGASVDLSVRPFGVGPRRRWRSEITEREREPGVAYFRDVMRDGPFPEWEHTHLFYGEGERTLCRDRLVFRTPAGPFAPVGDELAKAFLDGFFRCRHRRLRERLE